MYTASPRSASRRPRSFVPRLEKLEDRTVPTGLVTSEGDALLRANLVRERFRAFGVDGSGIKVGVISDGLGDVALSQFTRDLPRLVTVHPLYVGSGNEGTRMLEIVHDLAPGASLYFAGMAGSMHAGGMRAAISWMVDQGVNVIVDDIFLTGQPFFEDGGVAQEVQAAISRGVTCVTAAGNFGTSASLPGWHHYQADYRQGSYDLNRGGHWHLFATGDTTLNLIIPPYTAFHAYLQWDDRWGKSGNDYMMTFQVGSRSYSIDERQNGNDLPRESFDWTNDSSQPITASLRILRDLFSNSRNLELFTQGAIWQEYVTREDSIYGQAALEEVLTVGAANAQTPTVVADYSSRGPSKMFTSSSSRATDSRRSLDGIAIDKVSTLTDGRNAPDNSGTSFAAPHVAALAALVLDANRTLTPAGVHSALTSTALDLTSYGIGYDDVSGYGRFDALRAVYSVFTPGAPDLTAASDTGPSNTDNVTTDTTPTFVGQVPAGSYVALSVNGVVRATQQLTRTATTYTLTTPVLPLGRHAVTVRVAESATSTLSLISSALTITIEGSGGASRLSVALALAARETTAAAPPFLSAPQPPAAPVRGSDLPQAAGFNGARSLSFDRAEPGEDLAGTLLKKPVRSRGPFAEKAQPWLTVDPDR